MQAIDEATEVYPGITVEGYNNGPQKDPTWMSVYASDRSESYGTLRSGINYNGIYAEGFWPVMPTVESAARFLQLLHEALPSLREQAISDTKT